MKIQKKKICGRGSGRGEGVGVRVRKKTFFWGRVGLGGRGGGSGWVGGQGVCEQRIEVFVKIQKKNLWGGGGSVRVG